MLYASQHMFTDHHGNATGQNPQKTYIQKKQRRNNSNSQSNLVAVDEVVELLDTDFFNHIRVREQQDGFPSIIDPGKGSKQLESFIAIQKYHCCKKYLLVLFDCN